MTPCENDPIRIHLRLEMLKLCSECIDSVLESMDDNNWNSVVEFQHEMDTMAALLCGLGVIPVLNAASDDVCHDFLVRMKRQDRKDIDQLIVEVSSKRKERNGGCGDKK